MSKSLFSLIGILESPDATSKDFYDFRMELAFRLNAGLMSYETYDELTSYANRLEEKNT
jgi:hypothetical protein